MADVIDYKIHGDDMQLVEVELDPGEGVRAERRARSTTTKKSRGVVCWSRRMRAPGAGCR